MSSAPKRYESNDIVVTYDAQRCIHAEECVHGLPQVFNPGARPWIQPGNAAADEIAATVERCPTGALKYQRKDGGLGEQLVTQCSLSVAANGPIYARGQIALKDADGNVTLTDTRLALCRCGLSKIKPVCDGSHVAAAFQSEGSVAVAQLSDAMQPNALLEIKALRDGPLQVTGPVEVLDAEGRLCRREEKLWLCRCGGSQIKPFCDGTHKRIGFRDSVNHATP